MFVLYRNPLFGLLVVCKKINDPSLPSLSYAAGRTTDALGK